MRLLVRLLVALLATLVGLWIRQATRPYDEASMFPPPRPVPPRPVRARTHTVANRAGTALGGVSVSSIVFDEFDDLPTNRIARARAELHAQQQPRRSA